LILSILKTSRFHQKFKNKPIYSLDYNSHPPQSYQVKIGYPEHVEVVSKWEASPAIIA
jgi:hypothetical protein